MYYILIHGNYDYNEFIESVRTPSQAIDVLTKTLDIHEFPITTAEDFSKAVDEAYESGDWKGLALSAMDPQTGALETLCVADLYRATQSAHALLAFDRTLMNQFSSNPKFAA